MSDRLYTRRQQEVLALAAKGLSNAGIADALVISEKSVENHMTRIFSEQGIERDPSYNSRVCAVVKWLDAQ